MKKLSITRFITALVLACLLVCSPAIAQNKTELQAISDKMYAEGDISFILVQAYHDEVLFEGQAYKLSYKDGVVTINDEIPVAPYGQVYADRLKAFHKGKSGISHTMTGDGLVLANILNPESAFRKGYAKEQKANAVSAQNEMVYDKLVNELAKDALIDTTADYQVSYGRNGFYVNGSKLNVQKSKKYYGLYEAITGKELHPEKGDSFSIASSKTQK